jgi:hypothetical protein
MMNAFCRFVWKLWVRAFIHFFSLSAFHFLLSPLCEFYIFFSFSFSVIDQKPLVEGGRLFVRKIGALRRGPLVGLANF